MRISRKNTLIFFFACVFQQKFRCIGFFTLIHWSHSLRLCGRCSLTRLIISKHNIWFSLFQNQMLVASPRSTPYWSILTKAGTSLFWMRNCHGETTSLRYQLSVPQAPHPVSLEETTISDIEVTTELTWLRTLVNHTRKDRPRGRGPVHTMLCLACPSGLPRHHLLYLFEA